MLIGNNVQILLKHNQNNDLEIPHQHHLIKYYDDEKWMKSNSFEFLSSYIKPLQSFYYLLIRTEYYPGSVWQPPKSL